MSPPNVMLPEGEVTLIRAWCTFVENFFLKF